MGGLFLMRMEGRRSVEPDQKRALGWSTAAKIAWRELRASRAKFLFVILSVAIGVAALTGVRGFSESFQKALLDQARSIMAADLSARMFRLTTQQENAKLDADRKEHTSELQSPLIISYAVFCLKKKRGPSARPRPRGTAASPAARSRSS